MASKNEKELEIHTVRIYIRDIEMKEKILKEYLRRSRKLLETKPNSRNLIKGINTWAVPLVRYYRPFLKWTRDKLKQMDQRTRREKFKRETESILIGAQDNAVRTNHIKARIDKTQQNSKCTLCGDRDGTINHILSERGKLAQKEYKTRNDWVGKVIHTEMCKKSTIWQVLFLLVDYYKVWSSGRD